VTLGGSVKLGYFAQHAMDCMDGDADVFESLEDQFPRSRAGLAAGAGGCFGFSGDEVEKRLPRAVGRREGAAGEWR
jgi:ATPase subunit of ABC transporter with duplicated ATPase domains